MQEPLKSVDTVLGYDARLVKGLAWTVTVYAGMMLSNFILARVLPTKTYGELQFFISIFLMMGIFTLPGADMAITQAVACGHDGTLIQGVRARIRWSLLGCGLMMLGAGYCLWRVSVEYAVYCLLLAVAMPFYHPFASFGGYLIGKQRFRLRATCNNIINLTISATVVVLVVTGQGLAAVLAAVLGLTSVLNGWFYWRIRREVPADSPTDPTFRGYAWQMTLYAMTALVIGRLDQVLLFWMLGAEQLATYAIAISIPEQLANVAEGFPMVVLPRLTQHGQKVDPGLWRRRMLLPCVLGAAGAGIGILAIPWVLRLLFAGKYDHAATLAQFAFVGLVTVIPQKLFQVCIEAQRDVPSLRRLQIAGGFAKVVVLVAAVPFLGLWGAVGSLVVMRVILLVLSARFTRDEK